MRKSPAWSVIAVRWPVEAEVSKVTIAPVTAEPEPSFTVPWMVLGALPWPPADWADANPGINIIQRVGARHGIVGQNVHRRTSAAVRLNQTAIRDIVICSLWTIYTSKRPEKAPSEEDAAHAWPVSR